MNMETINKDMLAGLITDNYVANAQELVKVLEDLFFDYSELVLNREGENEFDTTDAQTQLYVVRKMIKTLKKKRTH